jgi:hypothetical protein
VNGKLLKPYMIYKDSRPTDEVAGYYHWCPACNEPHGIAVSRPNRSGARWSFNGNFDKPTFAPSVKCTTTDEDGVERTLCHYFITDGNVVFCNDNPHAMNGKTVALPNYPDNWR